MTLYGSQGIINITQMCGIRLIQYGTTEMLHNILFFKYRSGTVN